MPKRPKSKPEPTPKAKAKAKTEAPSEPINPYYGGVGDRLAWVRAIVTESQSQAAGRFSVHQATWNKWEKGTRQPNPWVIAQFCETFRIPTDWIWRGRLKAEMRRDVELRLVAGHPEVLDHHPVAGLPSMGEDPAS